MTATKTVEAPVSYAGAFEFIDEAVNVFAGLVRRYQSYSHLTDAEYDKELNARGFFPWLHAWELGYESYSPATTYGVDQYGWSDYTIWK